jgi:hypothetical protein
MRQICSTNRGGELMRKKMIYAAVLAVGIVGPMSISTSTVVFAQTRAQKCEAQYPTASQDRNARIQKNRCIAASNKK